MAQSILLRSLLLHRKTMLLPTTTRLRSLAALHLSNSVAQQAKSNGGALQESSGGGSNVSTDVRPIGEKIKENTKTASYTAIILAGLGVTGIMFYAIFRELFSKESSCNIYSKALQMVVDDPRVQDAIGSPIKGFGETSRRGRRQHVAHTSFERNGVPHMRMQFYVQGLRNKATVQLEARRDSKGQLEFRYLFVQLDHYPRTTIVLADNRAYDPTPDRAQSGFGNLALMSNSRDK
ncbi:PREDICTED: mitochondrial import inner membrane translocase subunit Tim21 [Drosophila arizonae]|uniref:Mitochondrial import inner membrane translocase subunit Tim21 n=1 Tax=Drosophila arizonae TaxID=7263 RepID=A0ABM1NWQ3_DROAR|nr:PREDICTED: mitochondrial import inner membrane translocase subunit Tim21 [Drosophila arizonae]